MCLGEEDLYGVPYYVALGISNVVSLGVNGLIEFWVLSDVALVIFGIFDSVFPGVFFLGSSISVRGKFIF